MTLREHTSAVVGCYEAAFEGRASLLLRNAEFKLLLCLHDLGKPQAVAEANPGRQHEHTCALIDAISTDLDVSPGLVERIKLIVDCDPIGRCLNSKFLLPIDSAAAEVLQLSVALGAPVEATWATLLTYYQCDAFGYDSLKRKVFVVDESGEATFSETPGRFVFSDPDEKRRFDLLEAAVLITGL